MKQEKMTRFISKEDAQRGWYVVDAEGKTLGRLATGIASVIRGKHKPSFTPNADTGDFVVVVNAEKVKIASKREQMKEYSRHSQYPGGRKVLTYRQMLEKKPEFVIENAVKGMLPKNRLGRKLMKKLKIYIGSEHPHTAQKPQDLSL